MQNNNYMRLSYIIIFSLSLLSVSARTLFAQSGTIQGIVVDKRSNLPINRANVVVRGTKLAGMTTTDGSYIIKNVPVGTYKVKVLFIIGSTETQDSVVVEDGKITFVSFELDLSPKIMRTLYDDCEIAQNSEGNFILYVSNQSTAIDTVDIRVYLDGKLAVHGDFYVGNCHNWVKFRFMLPNGTHSIKAVSARGEAVLEQEFEVADKLWAVIDYWFHPKYDNAEKKFTFEVSHSPIAFI